MSSSSEEVGSKQEAFAGAPEIKQGEIEFDENDKSTLLGEGSFGSVYLGKCRGANVAVKIPNAKLTEEQVEEFKEEVKIMAKLFHNRIALFMGAYIPTHGNLEEDIIIISEVLHGDMKTKLTRDYKKKQLSLYQRMTWAKQAAEGMSWLHGAGVIHRDLKPSNLLYNKDSDSVKVCDFGLSALVPKGNALQGEAKGTPLYVAPELVQGGDTTHAADVYSFGITMSVFLTRKAPFAHHTDLTAFLEAVCYDDERPALPKDRLGCPDSIRTLCEDCWGPEPETRPTFEQILSRFDSILVDSAVFDPAARQFWKKRFIDSRDGVQTTVRWDSFAKYFDRGYGTESISLLDDETFYGDCMKELFSERKDRRDIVTLPHFGHMMGFFTPLRGKGRWLTETCSLLSKSWFWGNTSSSAAHKALSTTADGSYLIRFSSSGNNFTISFRQGGQVWHTRIIHRYQSDTYVLDTTGSKSQKYNTLNEVIESMMQMQDGLRSPCAGGPFQSLFAQNRAAIGGYAKVESGYDSDE